MRGALGKVGRGVGHPLEQLNHIEQFLGLLNRHLLFEYCLVGLPHSEVPVHGSHIKI